MTAIQLTFILLTVITPAVLWHSSRRFRSDRFDRRACQAIAIVLLVTYLGDLAVKICDGGNLLERVLPMQLCDWALFSVCGALLFRSQWCFDLAYFWGLGGTVQALFTPDVASDLAWWRVVGFFIVHAGIVIGVLHKMLALGYRPRPRSLVHIVVASEIYLITALAVNALTGANYGFLAHKPATHTLLDIFSDEHWLYVVQINVTGFVFFALLYLPWLLRNMYSKRG